MFVLITFRSNNKPSQNITQQLRRQILSLLLLGHVVIVFIIALEIFDFSIVVGKTCFDLKFVLQKQIMQHDAGTVLMIVMIGLLMTSSSDCGFGFDYFHLVAVAKANLESIRHCVRHMHANTFHGFCHLFVFRWFCNFLHILASTGLSSLVAVHLHLQWLENF